MSKKLKINEVLNLLKLSGIKGTDKNYIPCENNIDIINKLINGPLKLYTEENSSPNGCKIQCEDGYLSGSENEGSFMFEWGFIVNRD